MKLSPEEQRRTVISSRIFDAPVGDVFDAYANPRKIVRWWGPHGFTLATESISLKEGGQWRFVFTGPDGKEYKNHLVFVEIKPTSLFIVDHVNGPKYHGVVRFDELGDKTKVTSFQTFESVEVFQQFSEVARAGNEGTFDRLGELLAGQR